MAESREDSGRQRKIKGLEKWRQQVAKAVRDQENHWWRTIQERSALRTYSQLKKNAVESHQILSAPHGSWNDLGLMGRLDLTRICCGHHDLHVCTGGWDEIKLKDRWCLLCEAAVETEQHFLMDCHCAHFEDERSPTALGDAISTMLTEASAGGSEPVAFPMQQLRRDEQWRLLTDGSHASIRDEQLRRRVTARILASIGKCSLKRKEALAAVAETIRV
jgi:hypothetical protein